jgi:hypothetical protein
MTQCIQCTRSIHSNEPHVFIYGTSNHFRCFLWLSYPFPEHDLLHALRRVYLSLPTGAERNAVLQAGKVLGAHDRQWLEIRNDRVRIAESLFVVVNAVVELRQAFATTAPTDAEVARLLTSHDRLWRISR